MIWYIAKLAIFLPLIGLFAWGSLRLAKRFEGRFAGSPGSSRLRIVETRMLSPTLRLAVIAFHDREILVSASKQGLVRLAEAPARPGEDAGQ
ncbi:flagellar biosynthetic protein FliO [Novosphingobium sp. FSW06-99]|uniref:flagellar biosynthetic protein FliO n=1 Tax=Novosphingobium sp. FSW06-99 TaxID=1739113 RepID=UPI00076D4AFF|nr:flagellar biosynthetic protein FliO [Novosphingobium sp. FSW06-99]KUR70969.1 flagellar biogenesis protein [Novosphingobium sp. FSW06-99]